MGHILLKYIFELILLVLMCLHHVQYRKKNKAVSSYVRMHGSRINIYKHKKYAIRTLVNKGKNPANAWQAYHNAYILPCNSSMAGLCLQGTRKAIRKSHFTVCANNKCFLKYCIEILRRNPKMKS